MSDDGARVQRMALSIGLWVGVASGVIVAIGIGILIAVVLSTSRREGDEHGGGWFGGPAGFFQQLQTARTLHEIARELAVSINTVKTHQRAIYRKLGVSSRREAVRTTV
ncbi:LuxR C-terminal-related transcriptional regulator [Microbacterium oxydans]|uniref:LuxR C-terminal-related transcriptional regulator n=1 Tax=Microbacterium oxydans TaxID=82380 RepID=UPI003AFA18E6